MHHACTSGEVHTFVPSNNKDMMLSRVVCIGYAVEVRLDFQSFLLVPSLVDIISLVYSPMRFTLTFVRFLLPRAGQVSWHTAVALSLLFGWGLFLVTRD